MTTTHGHKALRSNRRTFRLLTFTFPFGERPVGSLDRRAAARQDNRLATAMLLNQAVSAHPSCLEPLPRISIYFLASVGQEAHLVTTNTSRLRFVPPRTDFESVFVGGISSPSALHYEHARWLLISASQINGHGGRNLGDDAARSCTWVANGKHVGFWGNDKGSKPCTPEKCNFAEFTNVLLAANRSTQANLLTQQSATMQKSCLFD